MSEERIHTDKDLQKDDSAAPRAESIPSDMSVDELDQVAGGKANNEQDTKHSA